jgi:hypothetical protein
VAIGTALTLEISPHAGVRKELIYGLCLIYDIAPLRISLSCIARCRMNDIALMNNDMNFSRWTFSISR